MTIAEITAQAEELAKKYNPETSSPFPYENILKDMKELRIYLVDFVDEVSGAIGYNVKQKTYDIFINQKKPQVRQNFTIAHELGHYLLHKDFVKKEDLVESENYIDATPMLFRADIEEPTRIEIEANNFAAALLMPTVLVTRAWEAFKDVEECARVFKVSVAAMSIRLEKLGLVT